MKVILKQDVENVGRKGDIVNVAPGYGRNYLIPKKIALEVTPSNMKMIEIEQQALKKAVEKERASYQDMIEKLDGTTLSFRRKTGEKDIIFGSVSSSDVKDALHELGFEIDRKKILLDEPIKRLGNYTVPIKIFHEDRAEVKVEVVKEGEEIPGMAEEEKAAEEKPEEEVETKEESEKEEREAAGEEKEEKEGKTEEIEPAPERKIEEAVTEGEKEEIIAEEEAEEPEEKRAEPDMPEEETEEQEEAAEAEEEGVKEEMSAPEKKEEKKKKVKKGKKEK